MFIRRIHIENFRNLVNVDIKPKSDAGPIVLVGENNCGKSNLIHALRLLLAPNAQRLHLDLSEYDINDNARQNGQKTFTVTVEIGGIEQHNQLRAIFHQRIDRDGDKEYITLRLTYTCDPNNDTPVSVTVQPPSGRASDPEPMTPAMRRALPLYYLDATRDAQRDTRATGRSLLAEQLASVDIADVSDAVSASLHEANEKLAEGIEVRALSDGLTRELTPPLPGVDTEMILSVTDEEPNQILRNMRLRIRAGASTDVTDLERFGTGLHNLVVISIFRHMVSQATTAFPILAIEEPEAHLHPHAQRRLLKDLENFPSPIIISSHSSSVVINADPETLVLMRETSMSNVAAYNLRTTTPDDIRNIRTLLRNGESDLIFARIALLVEGEAESITMPAFGEALGCDFDRMGISIIPVNGATRYGPVIQVCSDLAIPFVLTFDQDELAQDSCMLWDDAWKRGYISDTDYSTTMATPEDLRKWRSQCLNDLGWFCADQDHEEENWRAGYNQEYIDILDEILPSNTLLDYARNNARQPDHHCLLDYLTIPTPAEGGKRHTKS